MKKKVFISVIAAALVLCCTIGGTLAWLTSTSDTVTNTFTVGNIGIKLDEAKVGPDGKALTDEHAARVIANSYKIYPGGTFDKDPTVTVNASSDRCYVFVMVDNNLYIGNNSIVTFNNPDICWFQVGSSLSGNRKLYAYSVSNTPTAVATSLTDTVLPPVFTSVTVDGDAVTSQNINELNTKTINVSAYAYQADGVDFATALTAVKRSYGLN